MGYGQADGFEKIAPCFVSDTARIKKLGEEWVLVVTSISISITPEG
jgi:hypothetical protein